jgi:hypothetical protein
MQLTVFRSIVFVDYSFHTNISCYICSHWPGRLTTFATDNVAWTLPDCNSHALVLSGDHRIHTLDTPNIAFVPRGIYPFLCQCVGCPLAVTFAVVKVIDNRAAGKFEFLEISQVLIN